MKIVDKILKHYNDFIGFTDKDEAFKAGYQAAIDQLKLMQHCESRSCYEKHGYEFSSMQDFCEHLDREIDDE